MLSLTACKLVNSAHYLICCVLPVLVNLELSSWGFHVSTTVIKGISMLQSYKPFVSWRNSATQGSCAPAGLCPTHRKSPFTLSTRALCYPEDRVTGLEPLASLNGVWICLTHELLIRLPMHRRFAAPRWLKSYIPWAIDSIYLCTQDVLCPSDLDYFNPWSVDPFYTRKRRLPKPFGPWRDQ